MGFDATAKRFFPLGVCGLIAGAAYFQATGVGAIIVGSIGRSVPPAAAHAGSVLAPPSTKLRSADAILARNAFDSVTGPLDGKSTTTVGGTSSPLPPVKDGEDPNKDPVCASVHVSLVTVSSDDPSWSFASLNADGKTQLRREGDKIGDAQVVRIGWFATGTGVDATPHVWLQQNGNRCIVDWGAGDPAKKPTEAPKPSTDDKSKHVPTELESKIHKKSDTEYEVERSAVGEIIKNYAQLAAGLRARQTKDGGVRLSGIKPNSILTDLGMKNGDVLRTINGYDMSDQDKALEAYAKLKTAKNLTITMERDKAPLTISIGIK